MTGILGVLGSVCYAASVLCPSDPPATPSISAAEYQALLDLAPANLFASGVAKLKDLATIAVWYDMCECTSPTVTPPFPPAAVALPAGLTLGQTAVSGCRQPRSTVTVLQSPATPIGVWTNVTRQLLPELNYIQSSGGGNLAAGQDIALIPTEWTEWQGHAELISASSPDTTPLFYQVDLYSPAGVWVSQANIGDHVASNLPQTTSPPAGFNPITFRSTTPYFSISAFRAAGTVDGQIDLALRTHCTPGSSAPLCCPDPTTSGLFQQLLDLVTLLQRQIAPFAYVNGAVHSGLVGAGELAVQGLIGCLVEVTAEPAGIGVSVGHPDVIWNAGWINWGNSAGFAAREWIQNRTLVSFPAAAGQYTRIGFSVEPPFTIRITELVREP